MNYERIMTEMKTVREFKMGKELNAEIIEELVRDAKNAKGIYNQELRYLYFEKGSKFFNEYNGKIGYGGKLIEAPAYFVVVGKNLKEARIDAGYKAELFRFFLEEKDIASCWISTIENVDYNSLFNLNSEEDVLAVVGFGAEYNGIFKKNIDKVASRKGVAELVAKDNWETGISWEELDALGLSEVFYLAKLAPSWGNTQPWSYLVKGNKIYIAVEKDSKYDIEKGIAALYLEKACEAKGFSPKINLELEISDIGHPENKIVEMEFNF